MSRVFRKAGWPDLDAIVSIYNDIHTEIEAGRNPLLWARGVYPTAETAAEGIEKGEMFVLCIDGEIASAARINREQMPEYVNAEWRYEADDYDVLVLHTLVVSPSRFRTGCATAMVRFYEGLARANGIGHLRFDTMQVNSPARALYRSLGFFEAGLVPCTFNGIPNVMLVCLEKEL